MNKPPEYQLVCPFPDDSPDFARGVEWEMWRQKIRDENGPISDYVTEGNADNVLTMCGHMGRHGCASRNLTQPRR